MSKFTKVIFINVQVIQCLIDFFRITILSRLEVIANDKDGYYLPYLRHHTLRVNALEDAT